MRPPVDAGGCANDSVCGSDRRCCAGACVDLLSALAHCGSCGRPCQVPTGTAVCARGVCAVGACPAPLADCDGNAANGCECQRGMGDLPDDMFVDSDGDGIDGTAARAIFVSPNGDDSAPGTREAPRRTVQAGINAAAPMGLAVYVAAGTYTGTVNLASGVSVYGGYRPTDWSRAETNVTTIQGGTTAVAAAGMTARVELQLLTLTAADAMTPGESSYGVRVAGSSGGVTLHRCTITAGRGDDGTPGTDGTAGAAGGNASGATPGNSSCGGTGGMGGATVRGRNNGAAGTAGTMAMGGAAGGMGGPGGGRGGGCPAISTGDDAPDAAQPGASGVDGANGMAVPPTVRGADASFTPQAAGNGAAATAGGGGGGGGSGGGDTSGFPFCESDTSGRGGGGGGGGCAGTPGTGGTGAGGSFAVMVHGSPVRISSCRLTSRAGGAGGRGGNGGAGGAGGNGSAGTSGGGDAGNGTRGREGGRGGNGGGGAGGSGGPSVCVYAVGVTPVQTDTPCTLGTAGRGGAGGMTGAPAGAEGLSAETHTAM